MKLRSINWPLWLGFLLSLFVSISYPFIFAQWPITRDFPWANLLLFVIAVALVIMGIRRAFAPDRRFWSKVGASFLTALSVLVLGLFIFSTFILPRWLPESKGAPHAGQKAPEFTLTDTSGTRVSLSELLTTPINGNPPKGVLLVFYRGYW